LTISLPSRSLAAVFASILSVVAVAVLLALPAQTMAHARRVACTPSSTAHPKRRVHACGQAKQTSGAPRKSKAHARPKAKGHNSKHTVGNHAGNTKRAVEKKPAAKAKSPAGASPTPATCEDGSLPIREADGSFSCEDESEPSCQDGSIPVPSSDGSALLCVGSSRRSGSAEAECEDGGAPVREADGSFSCEDESEPSCENGSTPTPSSDGSTLLCNAAASEQ
jgi:hypothetical protein